MTMKRSYYSDTVSNFLNESEDSILGKLSQSYNLESLKLRQNRAWPIQIEVLKRSLGGLNAERIIFEFTIPRMGKRVDNVLVLGNHVLVIEFKTGSEVYDSSSIRQTEDYVLDLSYFHETSNEKILVPILVATDGPAVNNDFSKKGNLYDVILCNSDTLEHVLTKFVNLSFEGDYSPKEWEEGAYRPTPTIIEAAQALYAGHKVEDITRYEAGETSLYNTSKSLTEIIDFSRRTNSKSIALVTGVPGAGKTLVGLNVVNEVQNSEIKENAVFLSGNGPLVTVLREALARDRKETADSIDEKLTMADARREVKPSIQNVHHFRNDYLNSNEAPNERIAVFDESQRAWDVNQTTQFVRERHPGKDFEMSEPQCLIDYMNRHQGWCMVICLVGGGQEINKGEAGINEWVRTMKTHYPNWNLHFSNLIAESKNYLTEQPLVDWIENAGNSIANLHLGVSVRSFRSEQLSQFIECLLSVEIEEAKQLFSSIRENYPIAITRNRDRYKTWLQGQRRGSERTGVLVSLNAKRLRPLGIDSENALRTQSGDSKIANWFLNDEHDVRSSMALEVPATEFAVQGLELDWTCVAWGGDLSFGDSSWRFQKFTGSKWNQINKEETRDYLLNTYRVLLTRARQGMIILIPHGDESDPTRSSDRYDGTYEYLRSIGLPEVP